MPLNAHQQQKTPASSLFRREQLPGMVQQSQRASQGANLIVINVRPQANQLVQGTARWKHEHKLVQGTPSHLGTTQCLLPFRELDLGRPKPLHHLISIPHQRTWCPP
eukprot:c17551_g1_i2.p1 GENE.c17551_g1_i2~~c17551_g1_i2.p1  ORF type:complete len:107 (-),score=9.75 c17551_g1_i2:135-455(-)